MKQPGLFDFDRRHKKLVKTRGFLENLNRFVDWEIVPCVAGRGVETVFRREGRTACA